MENAARLEKQKIRQRAYRQKMRSIGRPARSDIAAVTLDWIVKEASSGMSEKTRSQFIGKIIALAKSEGFSHWHSINVVEEIFRINRINQE